MSNVTNNTSGSLRDTAACYLITKYDESTWEYWGDCCMDYGIVPKPLWVLVLAALTTFLMDILATLIFRFSIKKNERLPFFMITDTNPLIFYYTNLKILTEVSLIVFKFSTQAESEEDASLFERYYFGFFFLMANGISFVQALVLFFKTRLVNLTRWEMLQHWAKTMTQKEKYLKLYKDSQVKRAIRCEIAKEKLFDELDNLLHDMVTLDLIPDAEGINLEQMEMELRKPHSDLIFACVLPAFKKANTEWETLLSKYPHINHGEVDSPLEKYFVECLKRYRISDLFRYQHILFPEQSTNALLIMAAVFDWHSSAFLRVKRMKHNAENFPLLADIMNLQTTNLPDSANGKTNYFYKLVSSFEKSGFALLDDETEDLDDDSNPDQRVSGRLTKDIMETSDLTDAIIDKIRKRRERNKARMLIWNLQRIAKRLGRDACSDRFERWLARKAARKAANSSKKSMATQASLQKLEFMDSKWEANIIENDKIWEKKNIKWTQISSWETIAVRVESVRVKHCLYIDLDKPRPHLVFRSKLLRYSLYALFLLLLPFTFFIAGGLCVYILGPLTLAYIAYRLIRCYVIEPEHTPKELREKSEGISKQSKKEKSFESIMDSSQGFDARSVAQSIQSQSFAGSGLKAYNLVSTIGGSSGYEPNVNAMDRIFFFPFDFENSINSQIHHTKKQMQSSVAQMDRQSIMLFISGSDKNSVENNNKTVNIAGGRLMRAYSVWMEDKTTEITREMWRRSTLNKLLVIMIGVILLALVCFLVINCSMAFYLFIFSRSGYIDSLRIVTNSFIHNEYSDCALEAFRDGDALGIFEFVALF